MATKEETIALFSNLTEEEYDYVKEEFDGMDDDKSGDVSTAEVRKFLAEDGGISEQ